MYIIDPTAEIIRLLGEERGMKGLHCAPQSSFYGRFVMDAIHHEWYSPFRIEAWEPSFYLDGAHNLRSVVARVPRSYLPLSIACIYYVHFLHDAPVYTLALCLLIIYIPQVVCTVLIDYKLKGLTGLSIGSHASQPKSQCLYSESCRYRFSLQQSVEVVQLRLFPQVP